MSDGLVKSAARAFEIMEVFAREQRRLSLAQLCGLLDYPKSSLGVLLKSLHAQGYLSLHPVELSYLPTRRLVALADWLPPLLIDEQILPTMRALQASTGETITLTALAGTEMRCLRVLPGTQPIALQLDSDTRFPILGTAVGTACLAGMPPSRVPVILREVARRDMTITAALLAEAERAIAETKKQGYAAVYDRVTPDAGAVAVALQQEDSAEPLVLAVAGLSQRIARRQDVIVDLLRRASARTLVD
ncbi:IclR family transcriptional regulator [Sandaracinobacteroides saxicola]|uniref:Helix-turn-helix domain-containing protein n=1 Tax=Sandaracinobacteroides saxicola TaxID=2759707 RepID=A0A7G5II92_9SPHN|nr:helix-turn-helix domain-containing protein [Sandaracinobacteroides saxicola]QMW23084.1 helix-turn-helix domain-containing protein [Sandaracinobacteroides saxicola]